MPSCYHHYIDVPNVCACFFFFLSYVQPEEEPLDWRFWRKRRYIVVMMAFFGFFNVYSLRVNLSVGIVAMTEMRPIEYTNGTIGYVSCDDDALYSQQSNLVVGVSE